ncbi:FecR family protein [Pedobacter sp. AW31-3R]|uniref:FecR family protein n=1 Tax=Pedobacter sp. AW31-3R TaxID=3445781 RepID=UPI003F9F4DF8
MNDIPNSLFEKLINNECSEEEVTQIIAFLSDKDNRSLSGDLILAQLTRKVHPEELSDEVRLVLNERFRNIVTAEELSVEEEVPKKSRILLLLRLSAVAASVMVIFSVSLFFKMEKSGAKLKSAHKTVSADVAPGKDAAILTLADGRKIVLTASANGQLAKQPGISITKAKDGKLVYHIENTGPASAEGGALYNTISTPRGGQYQVNLPDGSQVWLNSASSVKFPVQFSSSEKRTVMLTGEAYFEVAKDKKHPFVVTTERQSVEVLGTHFNVSSYDDDLSTTTTLLEGAVKVTAGTGSSFLKPGQQAEVAEHIHISNVDPELAVAWKNGYFHFDDEELWSVMNKISRWYDLDVVYTDASLKKELFAAYSTRFANVSQLLKRLNQVGNASFVLQGRKVIISPKK